MASFADENIQFTPYREQQPISAMVTAGMQREGQFQEGIQKVQGFYDSLLSLPLLKPEDQNYVKEKVNQLNNTVRQSISGDFSNQRLLNQIGGLASQISNDPTVQTGVQSSAKVQAGYTKAKADQERVLKEGKNPTNNINDYNDRVNAYMSDGQVGSQFNDGYTPYVDVIDRAVKLFKEQNLGQTIDADAFYYDPHKVTAENPTGLSINPVYYKGVDASRIQSVLNMVYSQPDVQAQFGVDGRQTFKGMDINAMSQYSADVANKNRDVIEASIRSLELEKTLNPNANTIVINSQIESLKKQADEQEAGFKINISYLENNNVDGLKSKLVKDGITSNFINAFAYKTMEKSPLFDADLEQQKFDETKRHNLVDESHTSFLESMSLKQYQLDVLKEENKLNADGSSIASIGTLPVSESQAKLGSRTAQLDVDNSLEQYSQSMREFINVTATGNANLPVPFIKDAATGKFVSNTQPFKEVVAKELGIKPEQVTDQQADNRAAAYSKEIQFKAASQYAQNGLEGEKKDLYMTTLNRWDNYQSNKSKLKAAEDQFAPYLGSLRKQMGNDDYFSIYAVSEHLPGWEGELKKLSTKYGEKLKPSQTLDPRTLQGQMVQEMIDKYNPSEYLNVNISASVLPGKKAFNDLLQRMGISQDEYNEATKGVNKNELSLQLQQREDVYKRMQTTTNSKAVTFKTGTEKDYKTTLDKFSNALTTLASIPGGAAGDADKMLKQFNEAKTGKFSTLRAYYDVNNGDGVIEGWKGDKSYTVHMSSERLFEILPELRPNTEFQNTFQPRLDRARISAFGNSTDLTGKGRWGDAYSVSNPNYVVQYHIIDRGNGMYNIKYWITDKKNAKDGPSIVDAQDYFPVPVSDNQIMAAINKNLSNPQHIQDIVDSKSIKQ